MQRVLAGSGSMVLLGGIEGWVLPGLQMPAIHDWHAQLYVVGLERGWRNLA
jgi:hypothetical protein